MYTGAWVLRFPATYVPPARGYPRHRTEPRHLVCLQVDVLDLKGTARVACSQSTRARHVFFFLFFFPVIFFLVAGLGFRLNQVQSGFFWFHPPTLAASHPFPCFVFSFHPLKVVDFWQGISLDSSATRLTPRFAGRIFSSLVAENQRGRIKTVWTP